MNEQTKLRASGRGLYISGLAEDRVYCDRCGGTGGKTGDRCCHDLKGGGICGEKPGDPGYFVRKRDER